MFTDVAARKAFYQRARAIAQWIAAAPTDEHGIQLSVAETASVTLVDDGAFVEATLFIPKRIVDTQHIVDASGRLIAPPQTEPPARPDGPWRENGK